MDDFVKRLERRNPFSAVGVDDAFSFASERTSRTKHTTHSTRYPRRSEHPKSSGSSAQNTSSLVKGRTGSSHQTPHKDHDRGDQQLRAGGAQKFFSRTTGRPILPEELAHREPKTDLTRYDDSSASSESDDPENVEGAVRIRSSGSHHSFYPFDSGKRDISNAPNPFAPSRRHNPFTDDDFSYITSDDLKHADSSATRSSRYDKTFFNSVDRPVAASAGASPASTYDSEPEYPFQATGGKTAPQEREEGRAVGADPENSWAKMLSRRTMCPKGTHYTISRDMAWLGLEDVHDDPGQAIDPYEDDSDDQRKRRIAWNRVEDRNRRPVNDQRQVYTVRDDHGNRDRSRGQDQRQAYSRSADRLYGEIPAAGSIRPEPTTSAEAMRRFYDQLPDHMKDQGFTSD